MPSGRGTPPPKPWTDGPDLPAGRYRSKLPAMKMHMDQTGGAHRITGYGAGYVAVNEQPLTGSFIVAPDTLITEWAPRSIADLDAAALEKIAALSPSIILLGTGEKQAFPPFNLLSAMLGQGIGVEIMTTAAACRTYNILVAEGRSVAAGLLVP